MQQTTLRPAEYLRSLPPSANRPGPAPSLPAQHALIQELSSSEAGRSTLSPLNQAGASSASPSRPASSGSQAPSQAVPNSPAACDRSEQPVSNGHAGLNGAVASSSDNSAGPRQGSQLHGGDPSSTTSQEAAGSQGKQGTAEQPSKSRGFSFAFGNKRRPSAAKSEVKQPQNGSIAGVHGPTKFWRNVQDNLAYSISARWFLAETFSACTAASIV